MRALVFSIDDAYVMPFKVLWHSLMKTESVPAQTPIFILHEDSLSKNSIQDLTIFLLKYKRIGVFLNAQNFVPDSVPLSDHISKATYYRLYIASILPDDITSVVYLDSDAVIVRSVRELFDLTLTCPIAAADHFSPENAFRLWGEKSGTYFQAGVLVIDLNVWRTQRYEHVFSLILSDESDRILWWDQDVLNIAFKDQWQRLPVWFNVCNQIRKELDEQLICSQVRFMHLDGSGKPWKFLGKTPQALQWYEAYAQCFGQSFNQSALRRPLWRRLGSVLRRLLKYTLRELRSI
jgi:lipopolysaccharide biosynthesis glycosyltransferase